MKPIAHLFMPMLYAAICASGAAAAAPSLTAGMPPEVLSQREVLAPPQEYQRAFEAWRTYADAHPAAAVAYVQMARAARYAGSASAEARAAWIEQALEIDPACPEALLARADELVRARGAGNESTPSASPETQLTRAVELAREAAALASEWPEPHFLLWSLAMLRGDPDADALAARLLELDAFSEPVVDFGYNLLLSTEPGALLFTYGDNDTYPLVALQAARAIRADVTVVNLALLNSSGYETALWASQSAADRAAPPFSAAELRALRADWAATPSAAESPGEPYAYHFIHALGEEIARGEYRAPVYFAVTVAPGVLDGCGCPLELQGMAWRVLSPSSPSPSATTSSGADRHVAVERTLRLFRDTLRLDSATSLAHQWRPHSAIRQLMRNYPAVLSMVASDCAATGDIDCIRYCLDRAIAILEFHGEEQPAERLRDYRRKVIPQP
jgi:hypothetical protein